MKLIVFLLSLAIHGYFSEKVRYDGYKLYKITPRTHEGVKALNELEAAGLSGYNFWSTVGHVGDPVELMVPPYKISEVQQLATKLGLDYDVLMENVQDYIDAEQSPQTFDDGDEGEFGWDRYHTLDEINAWLRKLASDYPTIVTLESVDGTFEGRLIYGVKLEYPTSNRSRSVFIESAIHAREWITPATTTYILNELITSTNATIRELAEGHVWYFFPVFNPDGYEYSHKRDRMWRKTRVPHSILCFGADPNRNWGHFWNHGGTSNSPCTEIYRGPAPFSEPSVRSMAAYITEIAEDLVAYISFHSFSQLLLIPYGYTPEHLDNYNKIYNIGRKSIAALVQRFGTEYLVGTVYETIYPASGSSPDWVKGIFGTPIVYTYELRDNGTYGFLLPPNQILPTALETLDSFITIFEEYYAYNEDNDDTDN